MIDSKILNETDLKSIKDDLFHKGYHIIYDFFGEEFIQDIKKKVITLNKKYGEKYSVGTVVVGLFLRHKIFLDILEFEPIHKMVRSLLGDKYIYSVFQSITLKPDLDEGWWHVDHPNQLLTEINKSKSMNYSFQMFILLDDFSEKNGATKFIPNSHKWDNSKINISDSNQIDTLIAKKGSLFIYNGNLIHSAGLNKTTSTRSILVLQFVPSFIRPQEDIEKYLNKKDKNQSQKIKDLFGVKLPTLQFPKTNKSFIYKFLLIMIKILNKILKKVI